MPNNLQDSDFIVGMEKELQNARAKFPDSNCCTVALMEEVGELAQALLKVAAGKWPKHRIWDEAIQVAVMACRVATEGDKSINLSGYSEDNQ